jgi:hypothetical protein
MVFGRILGIEVSDKTLARWAGWFAPDRQPFLVEGDRRVPVPPEIRDTFELYGLTERRVSVRWIDEARYFAMARKERSELLRDQVRLGRGLVPSVSSLGEDEARSVRDQADGRRFVWWPSLLTQENLRRVLGRFVTGGRAESQHSDVPGSGPNCFGTVMAAAGRRDAQHEWMQRESFEEWLRDSASATSSKDRDAAGIVMVWRNASGQADHAAVTLGSGWALHKPSQGWMSPSMVLRTDTLIRTVRMNGLRLQRYVLREPASRTAAANRSRRRRRGEAGT